MSVLLKKYPRIINRFEEVELKEKKLFEKYGESLFDDSTEEGREYLRLNMESYSLMNILTTEGSLQQYDNIMSIVKNKNLNRVFDIGSGYGHQNEVFIRNNIKYIGIDKSYVDSFFNIEDDNVSFIQRSYPFKINANEDDVAISVLCLTWNCYCYEENTVEKQLEALSRDFKHVILYAQPDNINLIKGYFKHTEVIRGKLIYANNL